MSDVSLTPATLVELLRRGLGVGIPPTALANMFDLDPEVVTNLSFNVRREDYGAAELSEKLTILTWEAIAEYEKMLKHGAPELKLKAVSAVLGKALATSVRQTPEEVKRGMEALLAVASQERLLEIEGIDLEQDRSSFVAVDVEADDQGQRREAEAAEDD